MHPERVTTRKESSPDNGRGRGRARITIATFALTLLAINLGSVFVLDELRPELRDPEYGRRIGSLKARIAEHPGRPLVLLVGSSRTAMGVRPDAWETNRPATAGTHDPLLFNLSLVGGGPVLELIVLQRAFADGIRPAALLLEYWPPLFCVERELSFANLALDRLGPRDHDAARDCLADPDLLGRELRNRWLNPLYASRRRLLAQVFPRWSPTRNRISWTWEDVDGWGWKPGCDFRPGPSQPQAILVRQAKEVFAKRFQDYRIDPREDRAFRDAVVLARKNGVPTYLLYAPESSEFRGWYPRVVEAVARERLAELSHQLGVEVIDTRDWMDDGLFSDGFHLTRIGAAEFTRRLGPTIAAAMRARKE